MRINPVDPGILRIQNFGLSIYGTDRCWGPAVVNTYLLQRALVKVRKAVSRRKTDDKEASWEDGPGEGAQLRRILGLFDLTLLGVGSTLGVGVYVLAGSVARSDAGPAVAISFLVAAIASAFAGVCYAEFAARVPKAGSAYVYSYVTVGELAAFVIGWNLILEYVIGTASVARAFSNYIDTLAGNVMSHTLTSVLPIKVSFLSPYPDFLSLAIVLVLSVLLAWGVKESALMNNIFTALNLITVVIVIVAGLWKVDASNWNIPKSSINTTAYPDVGEGGFAPFGVAGIMAGAAKCFFGFVGFDCVATTGEEAKNPQRHIPLAIVISLVVIFLAYFGISTVLTMMWPYYAQDKDAPLIYVFGQVGMPVIKIIVSIGAIFALCTSLIGSLFPMPRLLYAMSSDGLLFRLFGVINSKTQTALYSTFITGVVSGIMAAIFNLDQLIDMMSIGTLLAYTIVALCVLLLRYRDPKLSAGGCAKEEPTEEDGWLAVMGQCLNLKRYKYPNKKTTFVAELWVGVFIICTLVTTILMVVFEDRLPEGDPAAVAPTVVFFIVVCFACFFIALQPKDDPNLFFKVPFIPILPCVSIFINVYLMMKLDVNTWIRFIIWLIIGKFLPEKCNSNCEQLCTQYSVI
ncbi:hypothetical protein AAG570_009975 [Ranatra chinensis]|uniref:Cationic amino acid transporter C-terminal domain-containing protein n=1 Tax=Ranatra chinensis TaxID=642074 RepID=A0ABD0YQS6_9HEMI